MRAMLLDLLDRQPRDRRPRRAPGGDDRPDRRGLRPLHLQPRPVVLVVSGAQGDGSGRAGGPAAGRPARPARRRPDPHPGADRQSPCRAEDRAAAPDGGERDQAAHRRATRPRPRADVRHPAAGRERRVPARLRRPAAPDARVVAPLARMLATRLAARRRRSRAGAIDLRKTLRKSMSTGGVPIDVVLRKPRPARPELVVLCDVSGSVAGFSHFTLLLVHALRQQFSRVRVFAFIDTTDEVTHLFGAGRRPGGRHPADHPRGRGLHPRRALRLRQRVRLVHRELPRRAVAAQFAAGPRRRPHQLPQPGRRRAGPHGDRQPARALAQPRTASTCGAAATRRCRATRTSSPCTSAARPSSSPR